MNERKSASKDWWDASPLVRDIYDQLECLLDYEQEQEEIREYMEQEAAKDCANYAIHAFINGTWRTYYCGTIAEFEAWFSTVEFK